VRPLAKFRQQYNENLHELLADSGFGGGIAVGARRPELAATTVSHRAFGHEVSFATALAACGSSCLQWNWTD
jgi:hypothetical protein